MPAEANPKTPESALVTVNLALIDAGWSPGASLRIIDLVMSAGREAYSAKVFIKAIDSLMAMGFARDECRVILRKLIDDGFVIKERT